MKKLFSLFVAALFAASVFALDELPAAQVRPVLSGTYDATCNFGEWGSGTKCVAEGYMRHITTGELGYFGLEFAAIDCSQMTTLHMEVFTSRVPLTFRVVPIHGGDEQGVSATVETANRWVEIDLPLSEGDFAKVADWSNVYQIKIDNAPNVSFSLAEVLFYTLEEIVDDTAVSAPTVEPARKLLLNGQVLIHRNGHLYTPSGHQL